MKNILTLFILIMFFSCKTKHKVIEREKEIVQTKLNHKTIDKTVNDIKIDSFIKKGSSYISVLDNKTIVLVQADSSKTITVQDETGKKIVIKGANATIKNTKETTSKIDSTSINFIKTDKSKNDKSIQTKSEENKKTVKRNSDSDVSTTSTWLWFTLIVVFIVGALYFLKKYKIF